MYYIKLIVLQTASSARVEENLSMMGILSPSSSGMVGTHNANCRKWLGLICRQA